MDKLKVSTVVTAIISVLSVAPVFGQQSLPDPIYRFDPALSVEGPRSTAISADPQVVVEKREDKTSVRLQTEGPVAPYLMAEEGPELSAEELRLLQEKMDLDKLSDYRLEAGVGVLVEDRASLNLGYRFRTAPSLIDDRRNDPLDLSGDLRLSFDLKVPFD